MAETKAHRDAAELLSLLNDTDFRREAAHILDRLWAHWSPPALPSLQEFNEVLLRHDDFGPVRAGSRCFHGRASLSCSRPIVASSASSGGNTLTDTTRGKFK